MTDAELHAAIDAALTDMGAWLAEYRERLHAMPAAADLAGEVATALASLPSGRRSWSHLESVLGPDRALELNRVMIVLGREDLIKLEREDVIKPGGGCAPRRGPSPAAAR
jgi:hypothetical protein